MTMVCAADDRAVRALLPLAPTVVLYEPPSLIGRAGGGDRPWIVCITAEAAAVAPEVLMMHAGGVAVPDDAFRIMRAAQPVISGAVKAERAAGVPVPCRKVVNIASVAGLSPTGSSIAYAVSKAGLIHLTRCMAVALAPETLVNCVAPGLLEGTRATTNLRPEQIERSAAGALLKKAADKDDCADMVVTMCRTETMTGQTVVIDSGRVFH